MEETKNKLKTLHEYVCYVTLCMDLCMYYCMYLCIYLYLYFCMHVCISACMYLCLYFCMHVFIFVFLHACIYVCISARSSPSSASPVLLELGLCRRHVLQTARTVVGVHLMTNTGVQNQNHLYWTCICAHTWNVTPVSPTLSSYIHVLSKFDK